MAARRVAAAFRALWGEEQAVAVVAEVVVREGGEGKEGGGEKEE